MKHLLLAVALVAFCLAPARAQNPDITITNNSCATIYFTIYPTLNGSCGSGVVKCGIVALAPNASVSYSMYAGGNFPVWNYAACGVAPAANSEWYVCRVTDILGGGLVNTVVHPCRGPVSATFSSSAGCGTVTVQGNWSNPANTVITVF